MPPRGDKGAKVARAAFASPPVREARGMLGPFLGRETERQQSRSLLRGREASGEPGNVVPIKRKMAA